MKSSIQLNLKKTTTNFYTLLVSICSSPIWWTFCYRCWNKNIFICNILPFGVISTKMTACLVRCRMVRRLLSLTTFTASFLLRLLSLIFCRSNLLWHLSKRYFYLIRFICDISVPVAQIYCWACSPTWCVIVRRSTPWVKKRETPYSSSYLRQIFTNFKNSFIDTISTKFALKLLLKIPPYLKRVSTLPRKIVVSEN